MERTIVANELNIEFLADAVDLSNITYEEALNKANLRFNNLKIRGIHASRYIISWVNVAGEINDNFYKWMTEELLLTKEEADFIYYLAREGKMELELSAAKFITNR